jgi:hypothetical protein
VRLHGLYAIPEPQARQGLSEIEVTTMKTQEQIYADFEDRMTGVNDVPPEYDLPPEFLALKDCVQVLDEAFNKLKPIPF